MLTDNDSWHRRPRLMPARPIYSQDKRGRQCNHAGRSSRHTENSIGWLTYRRPRHCLRGQSIVVIFISVNVRTDLVRIALLWVVNVMLMDHTEISTDRGDRHIGDRGQCLRGRPIVTIVNGSVIAPVRLHYCPDAIASMWEALHFNKFLQWECIWYIKYWPTRTVLEKLFLYIHWVVLGGRTVTRVGYWVNLHGRRASGTVPVWALNSAGFEQLTGSGVSCPTLA